MEIIFSFPYIHRTIKELPYVDDRKMAVWGRGYGGYLAVRALAQDARVSALLSRETSAAGGVRSQNIFSVR